MPPFVLNTYVRFFHFLKKPDQGSYKRMGTLFKTKSLLSLMLLNIVFTGLWLTGYLLFNQDLLNKANTGLFYFNIFGVLAMIVLIDPFLEELIFRLPMKYNRNFVLRFIVYLIGLNKTVEDKESLANNVKKAWRTYFWIFFYAMSSLFAFVHIFNYPNFKQLLLWSPILTCTQFFCGMIIGYIRIRFGFVWGWYYHALHNMLVIFLLMAFMGGFARQNQNYSNNSNRQKDWVKEHYEKNLDFKIEKRKFKSYRVSHPEYSLTIFVGRDLNGIISGYGVTPNRIFFDRTSPEYILKTLSTVDLSVQDPDSLSLTVELIMKTPQNNSDKARNILEREMFKALSIK